MDPTRTRLTTQRPEDQHRSMLDSAELREEDMSTRRVREYQDSDSITESSYANNSGYTGMSYTDSRYTANGYPAESHPNSNGYSSNGYPGNNFPSGARSSTFVNDVSDNVYIASPYSMSSHNTNRQSRSINYDDSFQYNQHAYGHPSGNTFSSYTAPSSSHLGHNYPTSTSHNHSFTGSSNGDPFPNQFSYANDQISVPMNELSYTSSLENSAPQSLAHRSTEQSYTAAPFTPSSFHPDAPSATESSATASPQNLTAPQKILTKKEQKRLEKLQSPTMTKTNKLRKSWTLKKDPRERKPYTFTNRVKSAKYEINKMRREAAKEKKQRIEEVAPLAVSGSFSQSSSDSAEENNQKQEEVATLAVSRSYHQLKFDAASNSAFEHEESTQPPLASVEERLLQALGEYSAQLTKGTASDNHIESQDSRSSSSSSVLSESQNHTSSTSPPTSLEKSSSHEANPETSDTLQPTALESGEEYEPPASQQPSHQIPLDDNDSFFDDAIYASETANSAENVQYSYPDHRNPLHIPQSDERAWIGSMYTPLPRTPFVNHFRYPWQRVSNEEYVSQMYLAHGLVPRSSFPREWIFGRPLFGEPLPQ